MCPSGIPAQRCKRGARCQSDLTLLYTNKPGRTRSDLSERPQSFPRPPGNTPLLLPRNEHPRLRARLPSTHCQTLTENPPGTIWNPSSVPSSSPPRSPTPHICGTMEGAERHLNNRNRRGTNPPIKVDRWLAVSSTLQGAWLFHAGSLGLGLLPAEGHHATANAHSSSDTSLGQPVLVMPCVHHAQGQACRTDAKSLSPCLACVIIPAWDHRRGDGASVPGCVM